MILSFIYIRKVPREVFKTEGEARGFQHFPRDLANVNEWKIMFDPSITGSRVVKSKLPEHEKLNRLLIFDKMCINYIDTISKVFLNGYLRDFIS